MKLRTVTGALTALGLVMSSSAAFAEAHTNSTMASVVNNGSVQCGVSQGLPGFSNKDDAGNWTGIDVDFCRGIAAAVFGDSNAVKFTPLSAKERFTALSSGEVDVLSRNTTWTMSPSGCVATRAVFPASETGSSRHA